jgi:alpha-tubulin suppressor-like RCC1 family protein
MTSRHRLDPLNARRAGRPGALLALIGALLAVGGVLAGCEAAPKEGRYTCEPGVPGDCPEDWYCRLTSQADPTYRCFPDPAPPICGNGLMEDGEACDGNDFGGGSCVSEGFAGGTLFCTSACQLNTGGCLEAMCGDIVIQGLEDCDGTTMGPETCENEGFGPGTVRCNYNCSNSFADCDPPPTCGNGVLDDGEHCDGELGVPGCADLGFPGGVLSCAANCSLDTSGCLLSVCGNDDAESDHLSFEECDGADLREQTCATLGYPGGALSCLESCEYDTSGCVTLSSCGNGVNEGLEPCDGDDLGGFTCASLGYVGGDLACTEHCAFDETHCIAKESVCGNGELEYGEECDGQEFRWPDCQAFGFAAGSLFCDCQCRISVDWCQCPPGTRPEGRGCTQAGCGDGSIDVGENCDGVDLNGETCVSLGHMGGSLACDPVTCLFDESGCTLRYSALATGNGFACAVKHDSTAYCWGDSGDGQLGNGDTTDRDTPTQVLTITDFAQNISGYDHVCGIRVTGGLVCWGPNDAGQLGDDVANHGNTCALASDCALQPVVASGAALTGIQSVAVGGSHTCVVNGAGEVWCWGLGSNGQLGHGQDASSPTPVQATGISNVSYVAAGTNHTCALVQGGTVYCWGQNAYGQLGQGNLTPLNVPTLVDTLNGITRLASGGGHNCAIDGSRVLHCWGRNSTGQLGDNSNTNRNIPVPITMLADVEEISCGAMHTCAINTSGNAFCWGDNYNGKLGDGTGTERRTPVPVSSLSNVSFISAGNHNTCAIEVGGNIWCWGDNSVGQLCDGTFNNSNVPLQIPAF